MGDDLLPDLDPTQSEESFTFLGRSKGVGTLYVTAQELASSLFNPKLPPRFKQHDSRYKVKKAIQVGLTSLDELLISNTLPQHIDLVRIVTQGSEAEILEGAVSTCRTFRPVIFVHTWLQTLYDGSGDLEQVLRWARLNDYLPIDLRPSVSWSPNGTSLAGKKEVVGVKVLLLPGDVFDAGFEENSLNSRSSAENLAYILANYGFLALADFIVSNSSRINDYPRVYSNLKFFQQEFSFFEQILSRSRRLIKRLSGVS